MTFAKSRSKGQGSSSRPSDGKLILIGGAPGAGKTSIASDVLPHPHTIVAPAATNPTILQYPFCEDTKDELLEIRLQVTKRSPSFILETRHQDPNLFKSLETPGRNILLDDMGMLMESAELKHQGARWVRGVRWRGQTVVGTLHRPRADVLPIWYFMASEIWWVGSYHSRQGAMILYEQSTVKMEFEKFFSKLKSLEKYDFRRKNHASSVFVIKSV